MTTKPPRGRPPLPPNERRVSVHLHLPPAVLADLDRIVAHEQLTRTEVIERLVRRWVTTHVLDPDE